MSMARPPLLALPLLFVAALEGLSIVSQGVEFGCSVGICCDEDGICTTWSDDDQGCSSNNQSLSLDSIVTDSFFDGIKQDASSSCPGKSFYSRTAFLDASASFSDFGSTGSQAASTREIAAFFAHVSYLIGPLCYIEQINASSDSYCLDSAQWPCNPKKKYYARGPIQLSWNYNYGPAGESIGADLLNSPETVANDPVISFKTAFWFWMANIHSIIVSGKGFGATIRAFSPADCDGGNPTNVNYRVQYYTQYCQQLGVSPGPHLTC